ncbi:hypothetical protein ANN_10192 [Periplaneta americana]|uniref:palmitoyl-protein hydrolase n=1 Tax=Periplaneta americana TaxID=6978 RepID=A0ABQ8TNC7_PERAM|nr:hypothetical protein ANN_10192 [Periplaneta americana]
MPLAGDTGEGASEYIKFLLRKDFQFPHLQVLFPTAPLRPYTPLDGELSHVWFNRLSLSPDAPEHTETLESVGRDVTSFIQHNIIKCGIPENRIIVDDSHQHFHMSTFISGGFSMGGALAMHVGFRLMPKIAGVFALSSFLSHSSSIYKMLQDMPRESINLPPLFMCHGDRDTLVSHEWGEETFKMLTQLGVHGEFHTISNALHELKRKEMLQLYEWITQKLPPST